MDTLHDKTAEMKHACKCRSEVDDGVGVVEGCQGNVFKARQRTSTYLLYGHRTCSALSISLSDRVRDVISAAAGIPFSLRRRISPSASRSLSVSCEGSWSPCAGSIVSIANGLTKSQALAGCDVVWSRRAGLREQAQRTRARVRKIAPYVRLLLETKECKRTRVGYCSKVVWLGRAGLRERAQQLK
jgi:hypothetical protein